MSKWSGNQDADGNAVTNVRLEKVAALPGPWDDDWEGWTLFVTTPGPSYGPWTGSKSSAGFIRPGGGIGTYTEPGLLLWEAPRPLWEGGIGFTPIDPAIVWMRRALNTPSELLLLLVQCDVDGFATFGWVPPGNILGIFPFSADAFLHEVWWDPLFGLISFPGYDLIMVKLVVFDSDTFEFKDGMTIAVNTAGGPPPP